MGKVPETQPNEDFIDRWLRTSLANQDLDSGLLKLINEHRIGTNLQEDKLIQRLLKSQSSGGIDNAG